MFALACFGLWCGAELGGSNPLSEDTARPGLIYANLTLLFLWGILAVYFLEPPSIGLGTSSLALVLICIFTVCSAVCCAAVRGCALLCCVVLCCAVVIGSHFNALSVSALCVVLCCVVLCCVVLCCVVV